MVCYSRYIETYNQNSIVMCSFDAQEGGIINLSDTVHLRCKECLFMLP